MTLKKLIWSLFSLLQMLPFGGNGLVQAQATGLKPIGRFSKDTVQIGEPIDFSLSLRHAPNIEVLFPDTNYTFFPFELIKKTYFPTRTSGKISLDSVVYTLATFEIEPSQELTLPIFVISNGDSTPIYTETQRLTLQTVVKTAPENAQLKTNTSFRPVNTRINYPYLIIGFAAVLSVLILLNTFLGKPIQKAFRLLLLRRRHFFFIKLFDKLVAQVHKDKSPKKMERALNTWKKHIEKIDRKPYSTYTTKEITSILPDEDLRKALQNIDRSVYGGMQPENLEETFAALKRLSFSIYRKRREEIRNAK